MRKFLLLFLILICVNIPCFYADNVLIPQKEIPNIEISYFPFAIPALQDEVFQIEELKKETPIYTAQELRYHGVIYWEDYRWTWYSEKVLPGDGLNIPGRQADKDGYICDENNFICLASSTLEKGTIVNTPFGKQGKVYDCGCAGDVLDVYVNW